MAAIENLENHLANFQTDIKKLTDYICEKFSFSDTDIIFAAGSVVDGVGNPHSDIDLFLLTDRTDIQYSSMTDVLMKFSDCDIDVRVVHFNVLNNLMDRFLAWTKITNKPREAFLFTPDERAFLHRLKSSVPLFNQKSWQKLQDKIPHHFLLKHKLDYAAHLCHTIQIDLVGLRRVGDYHSMGVAALEMLGHAVDAFVASTGNSCPNRKWRTRHISNIPSEHLVALSPFLKEYSFVERFLDFYRLPLGNNPVEYMRHSLNIVHFARVILAIAEYKILCFDIQPIIFLDNLSYKWDYRTNILSHFAFDVILSYQQDNGFFIAKLGESQNIIPLSFDIFKIMCHLPCYADLSMQNYDFESENDKNIQQAFAIFKMMKFETPPIYIHENIIEKILA